MSNRFFILTLLRVTILTLTIFLLVWIWGDQRLIFNQIIVSIILVIEFVELVRFVNQTNRELSRFFTAIRYEDFSVTYNRTPLGNSFRDLQNSMQLIIDAYKTVKIEKEAQLLLLKNLIEQIQVGIITLADGEIVLINAKAQQLLHLKGVNTWRLIEQFQPGFAAEVKNVDYGGRRLFEHRHEQETKILALEVSTRTILDKDTKLITLQDINSEIEQKEIEAWHKLIRILTHEIMNSITPISSLTETMQSFLTNADGKPKPMNQLREDTISDLIFSLNTIHTRSEGLLKFVDDYRRLTKVPKPNPTAVSLHSFLSGIKQLMSDNLARHGIVFQVIAESDQTIYIDPTLIEQVIINLVTNSMNAMEESREKLIILAAHRLENGLSIEVTDTGAGIAENEIKDIFVPFYSTRKHGSGIGLSLSKQIVSQHSGSIRVSSQVGIGTKVTITLFNQFK